MVVQNPKQAMHRLAVYARKHPFVVTKENVYADPESTNLGNDLTSQLVSFLQIRFHKVMVPF